jgi:membrane protease YdiL (CAAX protease family)
MNAKIKDDLLLVACALLCAALAWAFWHFLGEQGFAVLTTIALIGLAVDNYRLRLRLRLQRGS